MPIITIDPGHGKNQNRSPTNPQYVEGTRMWVLAGKIKKKLEELGMTVYLTRPAVEDNPSLSARGAQAGKNKSDLMLSLHSNAPSANEDGGYDVTQSGTVVCYSQADKEYNRTLGRLLGEAIGGLMGNGLRACFYNDYPGKPGVDYFGVLRYSAAAGCPHAIIVEHGYHTNMADSVWLMDDRNLDKLAQIYAGILRQWFDIELPPTPVVYRVQVGAYTVRSNAEKREKQLQEKKIESFITESGGIYRVQAGAYIVREHALKKVEELRAAGFNAYLILG